MPQAKSADTVKVHYTGKLNDGTVFDSSRAGQPLQFTLGAGEVIAGFEEAVLGMEPGQSKTTPVPVAKAYGPHQEGMVQVVPRGQFPADFAPAVGQQLTGRRGDGGAVPVVVTAVSESEVTIDANHALAGKDLVFEIELVAIV